MKEEIEEINTKTELQKEFETFVFDNIKQNLYDLAYLHNWSCAREPIKVLIVSLRREFAKKKGLKTITQICPKPIDLIPMFIERLRECVTLENLRLTEEYRPIARNIVLTDENLKNKLRDIVTEGFLPMFCDMDKTCSSNSIRDAVYDLHYILVTQYRKLRELSKELHPDFFTIAKELIETIFTPQATLAYLKIKLDHIETIDQVA